MIFIYINFTLSQPQTQQVIMSQSRSNIGYLMQTYKILVLITHSHGSAIVFYRRRSKSMEKAKIRPLATTKPLNPSSPKFAGVITSWTAPGMQNFCSHRLRGFCFPKPRCCRESLYNCFFLRFVGFLNTAYTLERSFTQNTSNDVVLGMEVPWGCWWIGFSHWFIRVQGDGSAGNIRASSLNLLNSSSCWSTATSCCITWGSFIKSAFNTPTFFLRRQLWLARWGITPLYSEARGPLVPPEESRVSDRLGVPSVQKHSE